MKDVILEMSPELFAVLAYSVVVGYAFFACVTFELLDGRVHELARIIVASLWPVAPVFAIPMLAGAVGILVARGIKRAFRHAGERDASAFGNGVGVLVLAGDRPTTFAPTVQFSAPRRPS